MSGLAQPQCIRVEDYLAGEEVSPIKQSSTLTSSSLSAELVPVGSFLNYGDKTGYALRLIDEGTHDFR